MSLERKVDLIACLMGDIRGDPKDIMVKVTCLTIYLMAYL